MVGQHLKVPKGVLRAGSVFPVSTVPQPTDAAKLTFAILNAKKVKPNSFTAFADLTAGRPTIIGGGAKWNTIDRPQRAGLTVFGGYDPLQMSVPLLFDGFRTDASVEDDVALLWRMYGRGPGAPNTQKNKIPKVIEVIGDLLPSIVRFSEDNQGPPNWVVTGVDEDGASAVHAGSQVLVRLSVTVTLTEFVTTSALASLQPDDGSAAKNQTNIYPAGFTMAKVMQLQRTTLTALRSLNHFGSNKILDPYLRDRSKKFTKTVRVKVPTVPA